MPIGAISAAAVQPIVQPRTTPAERTQETERAPGADARTNGEASARPANGNSATANLNLSEQELQQVEELQQRDREVRAHEQAHVAAAGGLALGGPSFTFQYGPDGRAYAVGGEVNIDTSPGRTPEETIQKARQIRAAALAPAEPSSQDRAVAAQAAQLEAQARQELVAQENEGSGVAPTTQTAGASTEEAAATPAQEGATSVANQQAVALYGAIAANATPGTQLLARA